ncbi:MAG: aminoacyl-tRNA hydrolase [Coprococcus sp.]
MKIIVGLGNPGVKYAGTRHNIGFSVIDEMAEKYNISLSEKKHKAVLGKGIIEGEKVILAMPQTFMNLSGESVRELVDYYKCEPSDVIVIYDDIDLDVGRLRIREKGSAGGHNGMKNIILHIGSQEFARVRVGVGEKPKNMDLADYVLSRFNKEDLPVIRESCTKACEAVALILSDGTAAAMNRFNGV